MPKPGHRHYGCERTRTSTDRRIDSEIRQETMNPPTRDALPLISAAKPIPKYNGRSPREGRIVICWERIELDKQLSRVVYCRRPRHLCTRPGRFGVRARVWQIPKYRSLRFNFH